MRLLLCIAALAAHPMSAEAQRFEGVPLRLRDIERLNPAQVVLDHRKQLKLDTRQIGALDSVRKSFDTEAKRLADSVTRHQRAITVGPPLLRRPPDARPASRSDSIDRVKFDSTNRARRDQYFARVTTGRRDLAGSLLALKSLFDGSMETAVSLLTPAQRTPAILALESASEEFTRRLRLANIR